MSTSDPRTSSGTWLCPTGVTSVTVECIGGGGGGGGGASSSHGGGGTGGAYASGVFTVTPSTTYTYHVGNGGSGNGASGAGVAGGDSWFALIGVSAPSSSANGVLAKAGLGGGCVFYNAAVATTSAPLINSSLGSIRIAGGNGGGSIAGASASVVAGGGGGGGAGSSTTGNAGGASSAGPTVGIGGAAQSSYGGAGGNGGKSGTASTAGGLYGAGGGGGATVSGSNGSSGLVVFTYTIAPPPIPAAPALAQPTGVNSNVNLSWTSVGADSYSVYRNSSLLVSGVATTTYTDSTITVDGTYSYTLTATNTGGTSSQSSSSSIVINRAFTGMSQL